jgi:hypothetical protein
VQLANVVPLSAKVMVPAGRTGVSVVPVSEAVNVTFVFTAEGLAGEGVMLIVGCNAVMVCGKDAEVEVR